MRALTFLFDAAFVAWAVLGLFRVVRDRGGDDGWN